MQHRTCSVDECGKKHNALGFCESHYTRFKKTGRATAKTAQERFDEKTKPQGECIVWTKSVNKDGYGVFYFKGSMKLAHGVAWTLSGREVPVGLMLDHECRNPPCVNVHHLRLLTNKQNGENRSVSSAANKSSGLRGVHWDKRRNRWQASVGHNGRIHRLGYFEDRLLAKLAVIAKRNELFTHNDADRVA
ncbi:HNH endonuclease [Arthrobacter cryoconiti]|uniref:HNH endonuclease n=1 Tax=Arthrobacter cryoconiti TaxID=748907 RepID=A0ABV8QXW8_9MICC|nr:HNH endonuclease [Arthrobacter cryoconiti]MCC9068809.1 HNH endonuclease [Arthrobacter cryoconiti]